MREGHSADPKVWFNYVRRPFLCLSARAYTRHGRRGMWARQHTLGVCLLGATCAQARASTHV